MNAKLPAWLYWIDAAVRLLALVKKLGVGTSAPDARPLGLGGVRRRASTTLVVRIVAAEMAEKLYPVQISVGVPSGAHALVFGVRAMTEKTPDFVYVKIDRRNAYSQVHRASIMDALNSDPGLAAYARFRHAYYSRDAPIVIGGLAREGALVGRGEDAVGLAFRKLDLRGNRRSRRRCFRRTRV